MCKLDTLNVGIFVVVRNISLFDFTDNYIMKNGDCIFSFCFGKLACN